MPDSPSAIQSLPPEVAIGIVEYVVGSRLRMFAFGADDTGTGNAVGPDTVADGPCPILALLHVSAFFRRCTVSVLDTLWHLEWTSEGNPIKSLRYLNQLSQSVYSDPLNEAPTLAQDVPFSEYADKSVGHVVVARYLEAQLKLRSWVQKCLDEPLAPRPGGDDLHLPLALQCDAPAWIQTNLVLPILLSSGELVLRDSRIFGLNTANKALHQMAAEPMMLASEQGHAVISSICDAAEIKCEFHSKFGAQIDAKRARAGFPPASLGGSGASGVSSTSDRSLELAIARRAFASVEKLEACGAVTFDDAQLLRAAIGKFGDLTPLQVRLCCSDEPTTTRLENAATDAQSTSSSPT